MVETLSKAPLQSMKSEDYALLFNKNIVPKTGTMCVTPFSKAKGRLVNMNPYEVVKTNEDKSYT